MSAMAGSSVVTIATTITNELVESSGGTLSQANAEAQVKAILGLDASTDVSSYNAYAADNAGTVESVAFEKAAQQVMTVINTLAEAESTTSVGGSSVSKTAAISNAVAAFVDVIEAQVTAAAEPDAAPLAAIDFKSDTIVDEVVSAAKVNNAASVFNDATFSNSLSAIKTAITSVNKAIDEVTSLDAGSKQTFAVAQSALIDMTQEVASTNDSTKASITATTTAADISALVVVSGVTAGIVTEDGTSDSDSSNLVLTGTAAVTDPNATDNVTYTFDPTIAPIGSDSISGDPLGTLTITAQGVWTYSLANSHAEVQALGVNDSLVEVFQIKTIATDATDPDNLTTSDSSSKFITVKVLGSNDTPTLSLALDDMSTAEDASFSFNLLRTLVSDTDTTDVHTVTATLENGDALPEWLTLTSHTTTEDATNIATLSGTPENGDVGPISITLTYSDGTTTVSDTLTLTVSNTNDAPTLSSAQTDQAATEDSGFSYTVPTSTFADVDLNDSSLAITATGLPAGLTLTNGVISGTPTNADVGAHAVSITATDGDGETITDQITITVANTNDAPTVALAQTDQASTEDSVFSYTVPTDTFADVDANDSTLTITATGLPEGLAFADGVISGTPTNAAVGAHTVSIIATDETGATATDQITITVTNTNDAPTVSTNIADQTIAEDAALGFTIPSSTFADVDTGDTSTLSATLTGGGNLPDWLTFTAATGVLSGTPTNNEVGSISITITSTDTIGTSASDNFSLTTTNTNDAPTVTSAQAAQQTSENVDFSYTVPNTTFGDIDVGGSLTYSATLTSGGALPTWLTFDADTATFSGTPAHSDITVLSIKVTASDGTATVSDTLALTVTDNAVPTITTAQMPQYATQGSAFTYTVPADTFADLEDADTSLTITAAGLPDGLIFANGVISGTPTNADVGVHTVSIIATDSGSATATDEITITVFNVNDAPTVSNALVDQTIISGRESIFTIPADSFNDIDTGDTASLKYTALMSDGSDIDSWASIDEDTGALTANPPSEVFGVGSIVITATDTTGASVSDTVTVTITTNQAPVIAALENQTATEDTAVNFTLADTDFTDGDGDAMTVTVSGEPSWLTFNAETKTFSGTPTSESDAGTSTITVTATDASNDAGTATFNLVTTAVNDAPVMAATSAVTVAENTFLASSLSATDEEGDTITYTVTGGADKDLFEINSAGDGLAFSTTGSARSDMNFLLDSSGAQGGLMVDNLTTSVSGGATTLRMDLFVMPKVVGVEALKGIQFTPTSTGTANDFDFFFSSGDDSTLPKKHDETVDGEGEPIAGEYATVGGTGGANGATAIWYSDSSYSTNDMEAIKIGILKISNYDATHTYGINTLLMNGGDAGVSTSADYTLNNLTLSSVVDLPDFGDNASVAVSDSYSVEVTATDISNNATVQSLTVTLADTAANPNSSTSAASWTGTASADIYTIDSLTASADGGNGDNDVAKMSIENHTTWDTTDGTSDLVATLVDMEIIDIGNVISSNDSSPVVIGDFSTNMTIDATSAASMVAGADSTVSIMGTTNDIVTLSGTTWSKGGSSSLSSGDYSSDARDAWTDGSTTLYIDHDINIVTPDIA